MDLFASVDMDKYEQYSKPIVQTTSPPQPLSFRHDPVPELKPELRLIQEVRYRMPLTALYYIILSIIFNSYIIITYLIEVL